MKNRYIEGQHANMIRQLMNVHVINLFRLSFVHKYTLLRTKHTLENTETLSS